MSQQVFEVKKVEIDNIVYVCIPLAGPEARTTIPDETWDYDAEPIGPGSLGYGKTKEEIELLKDRYLLIPFSYYESYKGVGPFIVKAYLVRNDGVWECKEFDANERAPVPERKVDMDLEKIKKRIKKASSTTLQDFPGSVEKKPVNLMESKIPEEDQKAVIVINFPDLVVRAEVKKDYAETVYDLIKIIATEEPKVKVVHKSDEVLTFQVLSPGNRAQAYKIKRGEGLLRQDSEQAKQVINVCHDRLFLQECMGLENRHVVIKAIERRLKQLSE